jgi:hypothetical protein
MIAENVIHEGRILGTKMREMFTLAIKQIKNKAPAELLQLRTVGTYRDSTIRSKEKRSGCWKYNGKHHW